MLSPWHEKHPGYRAATSEMTEGTAARRKHSSTPFSCTKLCKRIIDRLGTNCFALRVLSHGTPSKRFHKNHIVRVRMLKSCNLLGNLKIRGRMLLKLLVFIFGNSHCFHKSKIANQTKTRKCFKCLIKTRTLIPPFCIFVKSITSSQYFIMLIWQSAQKT